ncbi:MAG TPA: hypothetical protein VMS17_10845 [Gemmataceae bacterium]|nr:hypothetical protein [Gemmataceae bacterium]
MRWLSWIDTLNLIDVFNCYLIAGLIVGVAIRVRTYRAVLGLVFACPNRWPKVLELVKKHSTIFLGWPTLLAVGLALAVLLCNVLARYLVLIQAKVTFEELRVLWLPLTAVVLSGGVMLFLDWKAVFAAKYFDRPALEVDLDEAESWLKSWKSPALRMVTFGIVNPRGIVGAEVHRAIVEANWSMIGGMWRWSLQIAMQFVFGLSLWLTWAWAVRASA